MSAERTVQLACDRCTQGVMDATNPHLHGTCPCPCHDSRVRAQDVDAELIEEQAQVVYGAMQAVNYEGRRYPWVPRGNSTAQEEARRAARTILEAVGVRGPVPAPVVREAP